MNKTRALLVSFLLTSALIFTGCFENFGGAYDGEDKIAFSADLMASSQASDEPAEVFATYDDTVAFETELIGPHRDSPTDVNFGVRPDSFWYTKEVPTDTGAARTDSTLLAYGTSAEEGTDYQISGTYTLPADSSTANLRLVLLDSPSPDVDTLTLRLDGNENENLLPAEQLRYLNVIITP